MWTVDCPRCPSAPPAPGRGHRFRATSRRGLLGLVLRHTGHGPLIIREADIGPQVRRPTRGGRPRPVDVFERALTMNSRIAGLALEELERRGGRRAVRRILRRAGEPL